MNIEEIHNVIIDYLGTMIRDNAEDIDIYDFTEDNFEDVKNLFLDDWENGYDIITEYFGNQSIFIPTLPAFITMISHSNDERINNGMNDIITEITYKTAGQNFYGMYANVLRHYAYHYINTIDYEVFLEILKEWVVKNINNDE